MCLEVQHLLILIWSQQECNSTTHVLWSWMLLPLRLQWLMHSCTNPALLLGCIQYGVHVVSVLMHMIPILCLLQDVLALKKLVLHNPVSVRNAIL